MRILTPHSTPPRPKHRRRRFAVRGLLLIAGLFVLANVIVAIAYNGKTYPGSRIAGKPIGSVAFDAIPSRIQKEGLIPQTVTFNYDGGKRVVAIKDLGIAADTPALRAAIAKRSWLPVANILHPKDVPLRLKIDDQRLERQLATLTASINTAPTEGAISLEKGSFVLTPAKDGRKLDIAKSKQAVTTAIGNGDDTIDLAVAANPPKVTNQTLHASFDKLKSAQSTRISFAYGGKQHTATSADISGWYQWQDNAYQLQDANIRAYIMYAAKQLGVKVKSLDDTVAKTRQAVTVAKPLNLTLAGARYSPAKTIIYCTGVRGVDASYLPELDRKLAMAYADERGWGMPDGAVNFVHADSGCNFTVWLSSSQQMASFGAICDPVWSCTVTPNVVINMDRWTGATDPWNAVGKNIDDYHTMAINHETGHVLGFNHKNCGGAAQPAPVMQQQSVDLQDCVFSPWPSTAEQAELRSILGI